MIFHDFGCSQCGLEQIDVVFGNSSQVRPTVPCECGGEASMLFGRTNFIHSSHSNMYGKYHVGFGEVVRDYHHKQQLLKKYNCIESAAPVGGSRCHRDSELYAPKPKLDGPQAAFGITPEAAVAAAEKNLEQNND